MSRPSLEPDMPLRLDDRISGDDPEMNDRRVVVQVRAAQTGITPEQVKGNWNRSPASGARGLEAFLLRRQERSEPTRNKAGPRPHLMSTREPGAYDARNDQGPRHWRDCHAGACCVPNAHPSCSHAAARQRKFPSGCQRCERAVHRQLLTRALLASLGGVADFCWRLGAASLRSGCRGT